MTDMKMDPSNSDRCHHLRWGEGFRINRDSFKHRVLTETNVFTDGSRLNEQTGLGYVIYSQNREEIHRAHYRLPDYATVFQAEASAITKSSEYLSTLPIPPRHVKIFVDSQAALLAISNPLVRSRTVLGTITALNNLAAAVSSLSLCWIPAHKGYFGNTTADDVAKRGAGEEDPSKKLKVHCPAATMKFNIKNYVYASWSKEWAHRHCKT